MTARKLLLVSISISIKNIKSAYLTKITFPTKRDGFSCASSFKVGFETASFFVKLLDGTCSSLTVKVGVTGWFLATSGAVNDLHDIRGFMKSHRKQERKKRESRERDREIEKDRSNGCRK